MSGYRVVADLEMLAHPNGDCYISSDEAGSYLKVKPPLFQFLDHLIASIRSGDNIDVFISSHATGIQLQDKYREGLHFLLEHGLIYRPEERPERRVTLETELLGHRLLEFGLKERRGAAPYYRWGLYLLFAASAALVVWNAAALLQGNRLAELISGFQRFEMDSGYQALMMIPAILLSIAVHEAGHIAVAGARGVSVRSVSLTLFMGYQPVVFVKYRNILAAGRRSRLMIYAAGMLFNLILANLSLTLLIFTESWIYGVVLAVNFFLIVENLNVINNTDFYYALCEVFHLRSFKWKALERLGAFLNKETGLRGFLFSKEGMWGNLYLLAGYGYRFFSVYLFLSFISILFGSYEWIRIAGLLVFAVYFAFSFIRFSRRIRQHTRKASQHMPERTAM